MGVYCELADTAFGPALDSRVGSSYVGESLSQSETGVLLLPRVGQSMGAGQPAVSRSDPSVRSNLLAWSEPRRRRQDPCGPWS